MKAYKIIIALIIAFFGITISVYADCRGSEDDPCIDYIKADREEGRITCPVLNENEDIADPVRTLLLDQDKKEYIDGVNLNEKILLKREEMKVFVKGKMYGTAFFGIKRDKKRYSINYTATDILYFYWNNSTTKNQFKTHDGKDFSNERKEKKIYTLSATEDSLVVDDLKKEGYNENRNVNYLHIYYVVKFEEKPAGDGETRTYYLRTQEVTIPFYKCEGGKIAMDTLNNPRIGEFGQDVFGVYGTDGVLPINIKNESVPTLWENIAQKTLWQVRNADSDNDYREVGNYSRKAEDEKYGMSYQYQTSQLNTEKVKIGDEYDLRRLNYKSDIVNCPSNTVRVKIMPKVFLPSFDNKIDTFICGTNNNKAGANEYIIIHGQKVRTDDLYNESAYGVEYQWEYKINNQQWKPLPFGSNSNSDLKLEEDELTNYTEANKSSRWNLYLKQEELKAGVSYKFRQKVILNKFNGTVVYADESDENSVIRIRQYDKLFKEDFYLTPMQPICQGTVGNANVEVQFLNTKPSNNYNYFQSGTTEGFKISYDLQNTGNTGQIIGTHMNEQVELTAESNIPVIVTVSDACADSIKLFDTIRMKPTPIFNAQHIVGMNCSTVKQNEQTVIMVVQGQTNAQIKISSLDSAFSKSTYYIAVGSTTETGNIEYGDKKTIDKNNGFMIPAGQGTYVRFTKETNGCESEPVVCALRFCNAWNNSIGIGSAKTNETRICWEEGNPEILSKTLSGAYGKDTYSYEWKYSEDNKSWTIIEGQNGETLPKDVIKPNNNVYYILREVTSTMGTTQTLSASNKVEVRYYNKPQAKITANGKTQSIFICYGDTVTLDIQDTMYVADEGAQMEYNLCYRDENNQYNMIGEWGSISQIIKSNLKKDTTLYGAIRMCGDTIYTEGISISVGPQLDKFPVTYGICKIKGDSVKVSLPTMTGNTYNFIYNGKVYDDKTSSIYIKLPQTGDASYKVMVTNGNCATTVNQTLAATDMLDRPAKYPLVIESGEIDNGKTCAGEELTIKSNTIDERKDLTKIYTWFEDKTQLKEESTSASLKYASSKTGVKSNVIRRTQYYVEEKGSSALCYTSYDTITVETFAKPKAGTITTDEKSICFGEKTTIQIPTVTEGTGKGYSYKLYRHDPKEGTTQWIASGLSTDTKKTATDSLPNSGSYSYLLAVQDNGCSGSLYLDSMTAKDSRVATVNVDENYKFSLTQSVIFIEESDVEEGKGKDLVLKSSEIDKSLEAKDLKSCELVYKKNESDPDTAVYQKGTGMVLKVYETDFDSEGALAIAVTRGSEKCPFTATANLVYSKGFSAQPMVKCEESESESIVKGCSGEDVHLYIDTDNLPSYNEKPMDVSRIKYQWYKMTGQSTVQLNTVSTKFLTATIADSVAYRCLLTYDAEGTGKNLKKIYSTTYSVKPIISAQIGNIYFGNDGIFSVHVCAGTDKNITLDANVKVYEKTTLTWQYSEDGEKWIDLKNEGSNVKGANTSNCQVSTSKWNGKDIVYFRLKLNNSECNTEEYSGNTIVLRMDENPTMDRTKVRMDGTGVIYDGMTSISFYNYRDGGYKYNWSYGADETFTQTALYTIEKADGFEAGKDTVYVFKESETGCVSDTIALPFTLYNGLSANFVSTINTDAVCPNVSDIELSLLSIKGGTNNLSDYHIEWQYKTEGMSDFDVVMANGIQPFKYDVSDPTGMGTTARASIVLKEITETVSIRAIIKCDNYPGSNLIMSPIKINAVPKLSRSWINSSDEVLCYDDYFIHNDGVPCSGGTGAYQYIWQKSVDHEKWENLNVESLYLYNNRKNDTTKLKTTTYFRRITQDKNCPTMRDTSAEKAVIVMPKLTMPQQAVNYYGTIISGDEVVLQPNFDEYDYVWAKDTSSHGTDLDTTSGSLNFGRYVTKPLYEETRYLVKLRYQNTPYCESEWDTLTIKVMDIQQVHLSFEEQQKNADKYDLEGKYWICNGGTVGNIRTNGSNGSTKHQWLYGVNGANLKKVFYEDGSAANGESLNVEKCTNVVFDLKNNSTTAPADRHVSFCRVDTFIVGGRSKAIASDTINVYIVPTLELSADVWNMSDSLAGLLSTERNIYCNGDPAESVNRSVSEYVASFWLSEKFTARMYDKKRSTDSLKLYWQYKSVDDKDWTIAKTSDVQTYFADNKFDLGNYVENPSGTYMVRSALEDGCSSVYSNMVRMGWSDVKADSTATKVYVELPNGDVIRDGFELGDSVIVLCGNNEYPCYWFMDSKCTDTLAANSRTCSFKIDGYILDTLANRQSVYLKRYDDINGCMSSKTEVPIGSIGKSDGGKIGPSQVICHGDKFGGLFNVTESRSSILYPEDKVMKIEYSWQYTTNNNMGGWIKVNNVHTMDLSSEKVDSIISVLNKPEYWFRRVATNEKGRSTYSDTVKLSYYNELVAGEVTLASVKTSYCEGDELPYIRTTQPTEGHTYNDDYGLRWQISLNDGEYQDLKISALDSFNLRWLTLDTLDRTKNNVLSIRCLYSDLCQEKASNEVQITLYRINTAPEIYEDNECLADTVTVKIKAEKVEKSYTWLAYDGEGVVNWSWQDIDSKKLYRASEAELMIEEYGLYSVDLATGCKSEEIRFNIDSMPELVQSGIVAPSLVCYDSQVKIIGGEASGGTGDKSFQWQYSYEGTDWVNDPTGISADYMSSEMRLGRYFRRIVSDKCSSDTSDSVWIDVTKKLEISRSDLVIKDHKCALRDIMISLNDGIAATITGNDSWRLYHEETCTSLLNTRIQSRTMAGFEEEQRDYTLVRCYEENDLLCESEKISLTIYNSPKVIENTISCDNQNPCNGTFVKVKDESLSVNTDEQKAIEDMLTIKWFISADGEQWTEQLLQSSKDLEVKVKDTMYIRRVVNNGCDNDTSNTVLIIGTKVDDYDYLSALSLKVVSTMADSSVKMEINGSKTFDESYYFYGDGELPTVSSNEIILPYNANAYKDSLLQLIAISDVCVSQYDVTPLRGGNISFDGDTLLCGGANIPAIVATDIEGGHGNYTYQWQYKNKYTSDFININDATEKEYTPQAVNVKTTYRRVTTDSEYVSLSNPIEIDIRPLPIVKGISVSLADSILDSMSLKHSQAGVDRLPMLQMSLTDSIFNVETIIWQKSYDGAEWQNVEVMESDSSNNYQMAIEDTTSVVYYRTIGLSLCGADTSRSFRVNTLYASFIMDEELVLLDTICKGGSYVEIDYKNNRPEVYEYSYRAIDYEGTGICGISGPYLFDDTTRISEGARFYKPSHSFDVEITRYVKKTGASSTKMVHFVVEELSADFSFTVDGVETHQSGGKEASVRINQGSHIVFTPQIQRSDVTYKWQLIEPLNSDYFKEYGGSEGREGLVSNNMSPECYYYNPINYNVKLEVTDGRCKATVVDHSMYIDMATFRALDLTTKFVDSDSKEYQYFKTSELTIYPTPCSDWLHISPSGKHVMLFDTDGHKLYEGMGAVKIIDMRNFASGVYFLSVDEEIFKVLKK